MMSQGERHPVEWSQRCLQVSASTSLVGALIGLDAERPCGSTALRFNTNRAAEVHSASRWGHDHR